MKFCVYIREVKRGLPRVTIGPLIRENHDGVRIENNAVEMHRRFVAAAESSNRETEGMLKAQRDKKKCTMKI